MKKGGFGKGNVGSIKYVYVKKGEAYNEKEDEEEEPEEAMDEEAMDDGFSVCQVTDVGGIDDKSFNATAWVGAQRGGDSLGRSF